MMPLASSRESEHELPTKRRIQRRHGACEPCRSSKTKCDGRMPCGACRSERRRQCPCVYSQKVMKLQEVTEEMRRRTGQEQISDQRGKIRSMPQNIEPSTKQPQGDEDGILGLSECSKADEKGNKSPLNEDEPHGLLAQYHFPPLSICGTIDEFKKLKPARGNAAQVINRCTGEEAIESVGSPPAFVGGLHPREVPACSSHNIPSAFVSLQKRLDSIQSLVQYGHLMRAWVDLGSLVREAELFRSSQANERMSDDDQMMWKQLWNDVLDLESQLGLALGRPTSLLLSQEFSSKSDSKIALTQEQSLDATRLDLYRHLQSILSLKVCDSSSSIVFLEKARTILSHEPFNQIGLCTTEAHSPAARDLQLHTHLLFMVIYCRLASMCDIHAREGQGPVYLGNESAVTARSMGLNQPRQKLAYCRKMFRSAKFVVSIFINLYSEVDDTFGLNWMRCHSVFIAATLLGIAKLRHEVEWNSTSGLLRQLESIFSKLGKQQPACNLFQLGIDRLQEFNSVKEPTSEITLKKHSGIKHRKRQNATSADASPVDGVFYGQERSAESNVSKISSMRPLKREREEMEAPGQIEPSLATSFGSNYSDSEQLTSMSTGNLSFDASVDQLGFFPNGAGLYSQNSSFISTAPPSNANSFCESDAGLVPIQDMVIAHPGPPFAFPFPYYLVHPPMEWNNSNTPIAGQTLFRTPAGTHLISSVVDVAPPLSAQVSPISQTHGTGTPMPRERPIGGGSSLLNAFTTAQDQRKAEPRFTEQNTDHSQTSENGDAVKRPKFSRRCSTETVRMASDGFSFETSSQWQSNGNNAPLCEGLTITRRASSVDDADGVQSHIYGRQPNEFFIPPSSQLPCSIGSTSSTLYHPMQSTTTPESMFFNTGIQSHHQGQSQLLSPMSTDFTFSCHQQEDYVQGHDQWRSMTVTPGVSGGP